MCVSDGACVAGAGMVVDWEQETGLLMTSGDVRVVRIWDTDREMKVQVGVAQPAFQDFHQEAWKEKMSWKQVRVFYGRSRGRCVWPRADLDQMNWCYYTSRCHTHTHTHQS